jgi:hypothetical protein
VVSNEQGTGLEYEKERRAREKQREEERLYEAVRPGNDLNRHVTGQSYAMMKMMELEQAKEEQLQQQRQAELRERAQREQQGQHDEVQDQRAALRARVEEEIARQNSIHNVHQHHQHQHDYNPGAALSHAGGGDCQPTIRGMATSVEKIGARVLQPKSFSSVDYFNARQGSVKNSHQAKLEEMREKRWRMENGGVENEGAMAVRQPQHQLQRQQLGRHFTHGGGRSSVGNMLCWE